VQNATPTITIPAVAPATTEMAPPTTKEDERPLPATSAGAERQGHTAVATGGQPTSAQMEVLIPSPSAATVRRVPSPPVDPRTGVFHPRVPTPQPVAGPSNIRVTGEPLTWPSNEHVIGDPSRRPSHLPPDAVPKRSTRTRLTAPKRKGKEPAGKGKARYVPIDSNDEAEEEDELESEEEMVVKKEPADVKLEDDPDYIAYTREIMMSDSEYDGPTTRSGAKRSRRRKTKAEPKTPALVKETDDEEEPAVIDRFAVAGENDPACNYCMEREVPCEYMVDEWITQCKLCQRRKVGCSVSAAKVVILKNSGKKRPRPQGNATTRPQIKKERAKKEVPRPTPAPRSKKRKQSGLGIRSRPNMRQYLHLLP